MSSRCRSTILLILFLAACQREKRVLDEPPQYQDFPRKPFQSALFPGAQPPVDVPAPGEFEGNAYSISEGQRLFNWYNCSGCHANGGGGMGPALMDERWIYGANPENIFDTIISGRPNGMPAWQGRIPENQVWQLVAYVRSLSNLEPQAATPPRVDHMTRGQK
jgi:cytochrome c oxidase cbb3-type subunit 3